MNNKKDYPIANLDEISKWLFDNFRLLPGCCSSILDLQYNTARMVAEALWPPKEGYIRKEALLEWLEYTKNLWGQTGASLAALQTVQMVIDKINSL